MKNLRSYALAAVGIVSLIATLALNIARASKPEAPTVVAATAHFISGRTYVFTPANNTGLIRCKVAQVDGDWLECSGEKFEWVNTNTMMLANDFK